MDSISKKIEWGDIYLLIMDSLKIKFFWYMENTLNGEISTESVYISVNNNINK